ncbi:SRPBCC domain-containing protein [Ascidiimonas aurantiaca]|uniref:SRPBCC family protein n=1 Tax=Ascidiimonas aurantiaca TaxID=1685432 RepID=UPI0030EC4CE2
MNKLSFNRFTKKIYLKASIQEVYRCWSTPEGICEWFLKTAEYRNSRGKNRRSDEFIEAGDTYIWEWHNWEGRESGMILKVAAPELLVFSFAETCEVRITLTNKGVHTLLCLEQYHIPTDEDSKLKIHYGCSNGWTFWLTNLKAYLEHGILLNEKEIDLSGDNLAGWEFVNM